MEVNTKNSYTFELISCIIVIVVSIFLIIKAAKYPIEASIFPTAALIVGGIAAIIQMVKIIILQRKRKELIKTKNGDIDDNQVSEFNLKPAIKMTATCISFVIYLWLIPLLGFYAATWLMLIVSMAWFQKASKFFNLVFSSTVVLILYSLFTLLLKVPLPRGFLI